VLQSYLKITSTQLNNFDYSVNEVIFILKANQYFTPMPKPEINFLHILTD